MTGVKKRYVVVVADPEAEQGEVYKAVRSAYSELFGAMGLAEAELKPFRSRGRAAIIRCRLEALSRLLLATAAVTRVGGRPTALRVILVSGTLRRAREAAEDEAYL